MPAAARSTRAILTWRAQVDAFRPQARHDDGGEFGVVLGEEVGGLQHGDPRAQPPVRLRHFQADRPAADHDQMAGQRAVGEDRLVGEDRARRRGPGSAAPSAASPSPARCAGS